MSRVLQILFNVISQDIVAPRREGKAESLAESVNG
jgi:hypothetical protein